MSEGRDFTAELFGNTRPVHHWRQTLQLDQLETQHGLPQGLLTAVLQAESQHDPQATNPQSGAAGLFQLMPATARSYGVDPYDPVQAAPAAAKELARLYHTYAGDLPTTLAGWNWGQGRMERFGFEKRPQETRTFIDRVLGWLAPASAEAATPRGRDMSQDLFGPQSGRDLSQELFASPGGTAAPAEAAQAVQQRRQQQTVAPAPEATPDATQGAPTPFQAAGAALLQATTPVTNRLRQLAGRPTVDPQSPAYAKTIQQHTGAPPQRLPWQPAPTSEAGGVDLPELITRATEPWIKPSAATAVNVGLTTAGALTAPVTAGVPMGALAGSVVAREFNKAVGFEDPGWLGDVLAVVGPLVGEFPRAAKAFARYLPGVWRARKAIGRAEQERQALLAERPTPFTTTETEAARTRHLGAEEERMAAHEATEAARFAKYEAGVRQAEERALAKTEQLRLAYEAKNADAYATALRDHEQAVADYRTALTQYDEVVQAQAWAAQQAQNIPQRYLPSLPEALAPLARTSDAIRADMRLLDEGGAAAQAVMQRLGARTPQEAGQLLAAEGRTARPAPPLLEDTGESAAMRPVDTPPAGTRRLPLREAPAQELELQDFIRQQGGIRLLGEELSNELRALVSRKETGRAGLQNNRTGLTLQQMADKAQEMAFIPTADKTALLDALRNSMTGQRPVYSAMRPEARLTGAGPLAPRPAVEGVPAGGGRAISRTGTDPWHQTSQVLYQRLDEVAGSAPVRMQPAQEHMGSLLADIEPLTELQPAAARLKAVFTSVRDLGPESTVSDIHNLLKDLVPYTSHSNGKIRYAAREAMDALQDAVVQSGDLFTETARAGAMMQQARSAWRKEEALKTLHERLRTGGTLVQRDAEGHVVLNVKNALNAFERLLDPARDRWFAGSFTPEELAAIRRDIEALIGTPSIPRQRPVAPKAFVPPAVGSPPAASVPTPRQPFEPRPLRALAMTGHEPPGMTPFPEVAPVLHAPRWQRLGMDILLGSSAMGMLTGHPTAAGAIGLTAAGIDYATYVIAQTLLRPQGRELLARLMSPSGHMSPEAIGVLSSALRLPTMSQAPSSAAKETEP